MQRALESRGFISAILAMAIGMFLFYTQPFPDDQIFLRVIAMRAPHAFLSFKYLYYTLLFTTPYLICSTLISGLYIITLKAHRTISPGRLPKYPDASKRSDLLLVVGEVHNPRKPVPAKAPYWLTIPERGLFTGIAILGAIGSGKTSCCMLPFAEQILAYKAADKDKRIGGLVLEVKGDFCRKVKDILGRHNRAEDYIEISLDSEYCYNPLHNDLEAYALAYNIASLLNNLFGRGKEPFWQQAYTNLVKFIILLHKAAYDYVTLFDVYQCAISPPLLEERITEAEDIILGRHYVAVTTNVYGERTADLAGLGFVHDEKEDRFLAPAAPELRDILRIRGIQFEARTVLDPAQANPEKLAQLEAVKRWFNDDWRRIEPKLRTSIVEGVSVGRHDTEFTRSPSAELCSRYENSPEAPLHFGEYQQRGRTMPSDHKSQSERDWAYTKRALARGDDPEVVIQRIADYRAQDKTDPEYYARRTVTKAQAAFETTPTQTPNEGESNSERIRAAPDH